MSHQEEFYPMPFFATLTVGDLETSTRWYTDVLGFRLVFSLPGQDGTPILSHLRWTKYADLLLVPQDAPTLSKTDKGVGVRLSFLVTEGTTGAGHLPYLEQPERFNRLVTEFLDRNGLLHPRNRRED